MTPIPADTPMTATLTAAEWNIVLEGLQELAYKTAVQVIPKLTTQLQQQRAPDFARKMNGDAEHATG